MSWEGFIYCKDCDAYCCGDFHRIHSTHNAYADSSSIVRGRSKLVLRLLYEVQLLLVLLPQFQLQLQEIDQQIRPQPGSREDLNTRFRTVTGRQFLDSKHKDFKLSDKIKTYSRRLGVIGQHHLALISQRICRVFLPQNLLPVICSQLFRQQLPLQHLPLQNS